jgi:hypothetical protein
MKKRISFMTEVDADGPDERRLREEFAAFCRSRGYAVVTTEEKAARGSPAPAEKLSMALAGSAYDYSGDGDTTAARLSLGGGDDADAPAASKEAVDAVEAFIARERPGKGVAEALRAKIAPELSQMLQRGDIPTGVVERAREMDEYLAATRHRIEQLAARGLKV